jgi:pimeloyl-ACP methyl ester carboxylesterase
LKFIVEGYPAYAYTGGRAFDTSLPTIVFIHGVALDHSVWQWQSRYFAHHGFGVLAVDLPGHGRSPGVTRSSIAGYADWIAQLLDAPGLAKAHIVGHSMGSLIALEVASRHRARVDRLALLATAAPMAVGDAFIAAARDDSPAAFDMQTTWGHARHAMLASSAIPGTTLPGASYRLTARAKAGVQANDLAACNAYSLDEAALAALEVPTLVVGAKRDQMTAFKAGKQMAERIRGAKFVALDCGHALMSEAPREVLATLRQFLR